MLPAHGELVNYGSYFSYRSTTGFVGTDTFQYTVIDNGGFVSNVATVTVIVGVNQPPIASDDAARTTVGVSVNIPVISDDLDVDGNIADVTLVLAHDQWHGCCLRQLLHVYPERRISRY